MMRGPPCAPRIKNNSPEGSSTMLGDIDDSIVLAGAIELASPPTRPNKLGIPGCMEKSSISLFSTMPVPSATTQEPNVALIVCVVLTAFPHGSTTDRCVVEGDSYGKGLPAASSED